MDESGCCVKVNVCVQLFLNVCPPVVFRTHYFYNMMLYRVYNIEYDVCLGTVLMPQPTALAVHPYVRLILMNPIPQEHLEVISSNLAQTSTWT